MASFPLKNYAADQVIIVFGGILIRGYGDGEFVTINQLNDSFTEIQGSDGLVSRARTAQTICEVTVTLQQTSEVNDLLSAIHQTDLVAPNGAGVAPLSVKDLRGTSVYSSPRAWIVKPPDVTFDRAITNRQWVFHCDAIRGRVDGSN